LIWGDKTLILTAEPAEYLWVLPQHTRWLKPLDQRSGQT